MMFSTSDKYIRDPNSNALVNTDTDAYQAFRQEREKIVKMMELENEIVLLKKEVFELKDKINVLMNGNKQCQEQ